MPQVIEISGSFVTRDLKKKNVVVSFQIRVPYIVFAELILMFWFVSALYFRQDFDHHSCRAPFCHFNLDSVFHP